MHWTAQGLVAFALCLFLMACGGGSMATGNSPSPPRTVSATVKVNNSISGPFDLALSTSFQPAEWDDTFFTSNGSAKETLLANLRPNHIRLQPLSQGIPQTSASTWDFSVLDAVVQPVLTAGDHSPEMQLGWAPPFMWSQGNLKGTLDRSAFAGYAQNMVQYYNASGFTSNGQHYQSPNQLPITWWGILNEPSINGITSAAEYTQIYNQVVPAMQSAGSSVPLKFVALELCCSSESWAQIFAANVTAQVDAVAAHYYSTCNQRDTDTQLMNTVPGFAAGVQSIYTYLSANPALANVPVWVTENNVNADFNNNGRSNCNPNQPFVTDTRGSSVFFAAWRPYVFSQLGKAGAKALYHWDFDADAQYGEVDYNTGNTQLSYWVDYWLRKTFPDSSNEELLTFNNTDNADIEVLPIRNNDGSVTVMISNHAVASPTDNNGAGVTANISVDMSAFGALHTASLMIIDSTTSAATGPSASAVSATSPISVTLDGYGVAFLKLQ